MSFGKYEKKSRVISRDIRYYDRTYIAKSKLAASHVFDRRGISSTGRRNSVADARTRRKEARLYSLTPVSSEGTRG